jgi:hypothetical protein
MTDKRRLRLSLKRDEALRATRVTIGKDKLVYILIADKRLRYPGGRSRIAYIGTTKRGMARVASSVASRAEDILALHGVRSFHARIVTCKPRQRVKTWLKLERALLIAFKTAYGDVPRCNTHGKKMRASDEFSYFHEKGVRHVLEELS